MSPYYPEHAATPKEPELKIGMIESDSYGYLVISESLPDIMRDNVIAVRVEGRPYDDAQLKKKEARLRRVIASNDIIEKMLVEFPGFEDDAYGVVAEDVYDFLYRELNEAGIVDTQSGIVSLKKFQKMFKAIKHDEYSGVTSAVVMKIGPDGVPDVVSVTTSSNCGLTKNRMYANDTVGTYIASAAFEKLYDETIGYMTLPNGAELCEIEEFGQASEHSLTHVVRLSNGTSFRLQFKR